MEAMDTEQGTPNIKREAGEEVNKNDKNVLPALPQDPLTGVEGSGREAPESVSPPQGSPAEAVESGRSTPTNRSGLGPAPLAGSKKRTWRRRNRRKFAKLRAGTVTGPQGVGELSAGPPSQPTRDESHPLVGAEDGRPVQRSSTPVATFPDPDLPVPAPSALAPLDRNVRTWAEVVGGTNASPLGRGRGVTSTPLVRRPGGGEDSSHPNPSPMGRGRGKGMAAYSDVAQIAAPSTKRRRCHGPQGDAAATVHAPTAPLPGYDAHFHPDRIRSMGGNRTDPGRRPDYPVDLVGGVLNYCDPEFYLDSDFVDRVIAAQGGSAKWKIAIGIHPKQAATYTRQHWQALLQHLNHPSVVGFSEVGFDFTVPPQQWRDQENLFRDLLDLGTRGRVLILHLRGAGGNAGVHAISRRLLRQKCPGDQRIHLHCFSGDVSQVMGWTTRYAHCYFGLSALVRSFTDPQRAAVREIPLDRLLLETDAPHLVPHPGMAFNTPRFLGDVGRLVAEILGIPLARLMAVTTANAQRLYGG